MMFGLDVLGEIFFFPLGLWKLAGVLHVFLGKLSVGATCLEVETIKRFIYLCIFLRDKVLTPEI